MNWQPIPGTTTYFLPPNPDRSMRPTCRKGLRSGHFSRVKHLAMHAACALPCGILAILIWVVTAYIFEQARAGRIHG